MKTQRLFRLIQTISEETANPSQPLRILSEIILTPNDFKLRLLLPEGPGFKIICIHDGLGNIISDNSQYNITKYNKKHIFVI